MQDILLDNDNDLRDDIMYGFAEGESDNQHRKLLLVCDKNEFKESPARGVGMFSFLNDEKNNGDLNREIRLEFATDGMKPELINTSNGEINIIAPYGS